ncbi:MAG: hypothetical protein HFE44_13175 [Oscillospiraceae bacterium]|jgi:beta-lactamase regulating signal transducer with metallopeptidase domain|nr:hypothetical protein [Oscillospiraceae bacterium]
MSEWLTKIFSGVLSMTVSAGWTILFVLAVRLVLYRVPKRSVYPLWAAVIFRLCCPFSFSSLYSLIPSALGTPVTLTAQGLQNGQTVVQNPLLPGGPAAAASGTGNWGWPLFWACLWAAGVCALLLYSAVCTWRVHCSLQGLRTVRPDGMGVRIAYLPAGARSTFLFGLFRPVVYLPQGLSQRETDYILAHELAHLRRGDHIAKPLFWLLVCIHWMNPLAWLAFFLFEMDMEKSCDERVLLRMGKNLTSEEDFSEMKGEYSSVLLALSSRRRFSGGQPLALGENGVKGRIRSILQYKKTKLWVSIAAVLVVIAVGIGLILNPVGKQGGGGPINMTFPKELTTGGNGKGYHISMALPEGMSAVEIMGAEASNLPLPSFAITANGETAGTITFYPFAADAEDLQSVDTSSEDLPMQIYATIALANHADYHNGYEPVSHTDTASVALCRPLIHDIENYAGHTPDAPWIEYDGILAYDMAGEPYFMCVLFHADILSHEQLAEIAKSVSFSYQ